MNEAHEERGGGVQNLPIQTRLLGHVGPRCFHSASGTAGHVPDRQLLHRHQGVGTGDLGRFLVQEVQALARLVRPHLGQGNGRGLAVLRSVLLSGQGLLQLVNAVLVGLVPARVGQVEGCAVVQHASQQLREAPVQADGRIGRQVVPFALP